MANLILNAWKQHEWTALNISKVKLLERASCIDATVSRSVPEI